MSDFEVEFPMSARERAELWRQVLSTGELVSPEAQRLAALAEREQGGEDEPDGAPV